MGRRVIALKWAGTCADCGAELAPGDRARYYGRGRIYGADCHERDGTPRADWKAKLATKCRGCDGHGTVRSTSGGKIPCRNCDGTGSRAVEDFARAGGHRRRGPVDDSPGARASYHDPRGAYAADGTFLGTVGPKCEDAPCCGCCSA